MRLRELLHSLNIQQLQGDVEVEITGLCYDSRAVSKGDLFFALSGVHEDGRRYSEQAVAAGAVAIVHEGQLAQNTKAVQVKVANARKTMAQIAAAFYGQPAEKMTVIGVTGTNGKTTVATLIESLLRSCGRRPAVIGTVEYRFETDRREALHTTPEAPDLMALIDAFSRQGADALVMEVSSHALAQHRVDGLRFDAAVFTNLTPEHLDYHGDMESYFSSKARLFTELLKPEGLAVINTDDPYGQRLSKDFPEAWTYGAGATVAVGVSAIVQNIEGTRGVLRYRNEEKSFVSPLVGEFNLSNLLAATTVAVGLGHDLKTLGNALASAKGAPGRLEQVENPYGVLAVVDYAHTGDALEQVLQALHKLKEKRIVTVFGCGGDRDKGKRPVMGQIAASLSDLAVLTSDNPRTEDPHEILAEVEAGMSNEMSRVDHFAGCQHGYRVVEDRAEAIQVAVDAVDAGDILLVAGKGHEDYQVLRTGRIDFDDREVLRRSFAKRGPQ